MTSEEKIQYLSLAYMIIKEFSKVKNKTEKDVFVINSSKYVFESMTKLLEAFRDIIKHTDTENFRKFLCTDTSYEGPKVIQNQVVPKKDTRTIDAAIGVGLFINQSIVDGNKVEQDLETQQIHEFNELMSGVSDFDANCNVDCNIDSI